MKPVSAKTLLPAETRVFVDNEEIQGFGRICGVASRTEASIVYVVEIGSGPYPCICVPHNQLRKVGPKAVFSSRDMAGFAAGHPLSNAEWKRWCQFCVDDRDGSQTKKLAISQ